MAIFRIEKNKNFTVMSNHHLRDKNLSLKAKGLLSLMLSLPDNWDYTLAGLVYICKDGIASIRTTIMELEEKGYLLRCRLRNEKGQLVDTEYAIHEMPQGCGKLVDNSPPECEKPICGNLILDNPTLVKPILENQMQSNTNQSRKEKINTEAINIYPSITNYQQIRKESRFDKIDLMYAIEKYRKIIYKNIEYEILLERYDAACINEYIEIMLDAICSQSETIRIGGVDYPVEVVKSRFLKLESSHIEYVIHNMAKNATKIRNIKSYLLTALYNSYSTMDNFYRTEANHDLKHVLDG